MSIISELNVPSEILLEEDHFASSAFCLIPIMVIASAPLAVPVTDTYLLFMPEVVILFLPQSRELNKLVGEVRVSVYLLWNPIMALLIVWIASCLH